MTYMTRQYRLPELDEINLGSNKMCWPGSNWFFITPFIDKKKT